MVLVGMAVLTAASGALAMAGGDPGRDTDPASPELAARTGADAPDTNVPDPTSIPTSTPTTTSTSTVPATTAAPTTAPPTTPAPTAAPTTAPPTSPATTAAPTTPAPTAPPSTQAVVAPANQCDPNYSGACVPIASDVDCAGGSGNGPAYVAGPVTVIGSDIYGLDADDDGVGCE